MTTDVNRTPRHHAMVDFHQHQERLYVVLEEDHEKVEKERDELLALLCEVRSAILPHWRPTTLVATCTKSKVISAIDGALSAPPKEVKS